MDNIINQLIEDLIIYYEVENFIIKDNDFKEDMILRNILKDYIKRKINNNKQIKEKYIKENKQNFKQFLEILKNKF